MWFTSRWMVSYFLCAGRIFLWRPPRWLPRWRLCYHQARLLPFRLMLDRPANACLFPPLSPFPALMWVSRCRGTQSIVGTVAKSAAPSAGIATIGLGTNIEALLVQLAQQRQELANEVQVLEENVAQLKARGQQAGLIPTSTEFQMELAADRPRGLLEMVLGPRTWEVWPTMHDTDWPWRAHACAHQRS